MDTKDQTTSKTQQSEADLQSNIFSSDMPTLIPIPSSNEGRRYDHASELFSHYMVICAENTKGKPGIEVLDLDTNRWVSVEFQGNTFYTRRNEYYTCKKSENEIVLYGGLGSVLWDNDIVVLTLEYIDGIC